MWRKTVGRERSRDRCSHQIIDARAPMKLHGILLILQLALISASGQAADQTPQWVVDPAMPGPDLPHAGVSLFDRLTSNARGEQSIPYPFERLIARIEAAAGCSAAQPCARTVLI